MQPRGGSCICNRKLISDTHKKKTATHAPAPIHSFTTCHNLGRWGDWVSCRPVSQPAETNRPRSATIPNETRDAEKRAGIASVRGRSRGGGWWGDWRSPRPWPVASLRSLLCQQLRMAAAARVRRIRDLDPVWFGGRGGKKARTRRTLPWKRGSRNRMPSCSVLLRNEGGSRLHEAGTTTTSAQLAKGPPRIEV